MYSYYRFSYYRFYQFFFSFSKATLNNLIRSLKLWESSTCQQQSNILHRT
jgi:hypothetical protein